MSAEGRLFKPDRDFTKEVDKQLPEAQELAKVNFKMQEGVSTEL